MGSNLVLNALPLPGLRPDSLGDYLASLGLLRLLARKWPKVRMAWRDHVLHFVGGPTNLNELLDDLVSIADNRSWTPYNHEWKEAQKKSAKAKTGKFLAIWQTITDEETLEISFAHAVPRRRVAFNPLLGTGGNDGKRFFSAGWRQAVEALQFSGQKKKATKIGSDKRDELQRYLLGQPITWMVEKLNAASWFGDANKLYNSGQNPSREGQISPWAMVLACEGLPFWTGAASRRLGARVSAHAAFPFVSSAANPSKANEKERDKAEIWLPIWERPMNLPEVRSLFLRGRAEIGRRGVLTSSEFATSIVRRGVDAGIFEFFRFALSHTTSANTFEPRLLSRIQVQPSLFDDHALKVKPKLFECVLDLINRLPAEKTEGRFVGLRGPIESALVRAAERQDDPEVACKLVDTVVSALDILDRNRAYRDSGVSWKPLPIEWLSLLFGEILPGVEARLAMALVSSFPLSQPFGLYRFGVESKGERFLHPKRPPFRWVWGPGELAKVLARVVVRRTFDWESSKKNGLEAKGPVRFLLPAGAEDVHRWLDGAVDEGLLARWISRLALFEWRSKPSKICAPVEKTERKCAVGPSLCLFGLFQPLFDLRPVYATHGPSNGNLLPPESGARTPGTARALARLIQGGQIEAAVRLAGSRYAMAAVPVAHLEASLRVPDPERLLASILFPIASHDRAMLVNRWLKPRRKQGELAND